MDDLAIEQATAAVTILEGMLGQDLRAAYLYGSATLAGLRPGSDLDVFVVSARRTSSEENWELARRLTPLSSAAQRPAGWRPLEVTMVAFPDIEPWRHPATRDFQFGEWFRAGIDAGTAELGPVVDADVALLITQVRQFGRVLFGPAPGELLPEVPKSDLFLALQRTVEDVMPGLQDDSTMGLLTLARVWYTLETDSFVSKDVAGEWASQRLESSLRMALDLAVATYRGERAADWDAVRPQMVATADAMVSAIGRYERLP